MTAWVKSDGVVRYDPRAYGADPDQTLAALEEELLPLVAAIMAALCPEVLA